MPSKRTTRSTSNFQFRLISGWTIITGLSVVPVLLWATTNNYFSAFSGFYGSVSSLGELAGLIGIIMYALNFVLATRLKFLEYWFGGMNRVYVAHHIWGGLALVMLSLHPLFLMLRSITSSARESALLVIPHNLTPVGALFDKNTVEHYLVLQQWAVFFGIIAFIGLVLLMILTFFVKLPYSLWLFTHKFLGLAFFFAGLHVLFVNSDTSISSPLKWYILGAVTIGLAAYVYRSLLDNILVRKYRYAVESVKVHSGNVTRIKLKPTGVPLSHRPGQFIFIRFIGAETIKAEWHPFSVSSAPKDKYIELSVKAVGDFTKSLKKITPGTIAEIEGAYGQFSYVNYQNKNHIWVAGGIGITPFLSMAKTLPAYKDYKIDLYYCVTKQSELIDSDELAKVAAIGQNHFRVIPYIANEHGSITADIIRKKSHGLEGKEIFICGPPPMMKSLRKQFIENGVPPKTIHTEEFAIQ